MVDSNEKFNSFKQPFEIEKIKKNNFCQSQLASSSDKALQYPLLLQLEHHFCCNTSSTSLTLGSITFLLPHSHLTTGYSIT